jgi:hypothetical protein
LTALIEVEPRVSPPRGRVNKISDALGSTRFRGVHDGGKCLTRTQIEMLSGFPVCCAYAATVTLMCDRFGIGR